MGKGTRLLALGTICVALAALTACASVRPIGRLLDDPYRFDGKVVRIEGEVVDAAGALGYGAYRVDDGTGTLVIVSDGGGVPRKGARVRVAGRFQPLLTVGPTSVAGMLERNRGHPR